MSAKTSAEVIIGGKVYTLSGYESEEYLQKVAAYINNKLSDLNDIKEYRHLPVPMKATLVELNIADDYFKAKSRVDKLEHELEQKEKEIYDLKHDLISTQIKIQAAEAETSKLEAENQKLLLDKTRLETTLQDAKRMEESFQSSPRSTVQRSEDDSALIKPVSEGQESTVTLDSTVDSPAESTGDIAAESPAALINNTASPTSAVNTSNASSADIVETTASRTTSASSSRRRRSTDRRTSTK